MFEKFGVNGYQTMPASMCALYAAGRTTGLVVRVGDGGASTYGMWEGSL